MYFNLLAQKHDRVTCATKQIERDSKDTDAINSYPEKVQIKLVWVAIYKLVATVKWFKIYLLTLIKSW